MLHQQVSVRKNVNTPSDPNLFKKQSHQSYANVLNKHGVGKNQCLWQKMCVQKNTIFFIPFFYQGSYRLGCTNLCKNGHLCCLVKFSQKKNIILDNSKLSQKSDNLSWLSQHWNNILVHLHTKLIRLFRKLFKLNSLINQTFFVIEV